MNKILRRILVCCGLIYISNSQAASTTNLNAPKDISEKPVTKLIDKDTWISLYKPTFIFPIYFINRPNDSVYQKNDPSTPHLKHIETNFQISFKVPIWHITKNNIIYGAYTQQSFWQFYNHSPFFRETDFEPELFLMNKFDISLCGEWKIKYLNIGANHQSNGFGGTLERSWNRVFTEGGLANENWLIDLNVWYAPKNGSMKQHNPDINHFLGYGNILISYKFYNQVLSLQLRRKTEQFNWSFPLTSHIRGYIQAFTGYGQSLIEYNHYSTNAGIGIILNDWI